MVKDNNFLGKFTLKDRMGLHTDGRAQNAEFLYHQLEE